MNQAAVKKLIDQQIAGLGARVSSLEGLGNVLLSSSLASGRAEAARYKWCFLCAQLSCLLVPAKLFISFDNDRILVLNGVLENKPGFRDFCGDNYPGELELDELREKTFFYLSELSGINVDNDEVISWQKPLFLHSN